MAFDGSNTFDADSWSVWDNVSFFGMFNPALQYYWTYKDELFINPFIKGNAKKLGW
jgi:hypothetical protein